MPLVLYSGFVPDFMRQNNSPLNRAHSIALGQQVAPGKRECGGVSEQESTVIASRIFRPFSWSKSAQSSNVDFRAVLLQCQRLKRLAGRRLLRERSQSEREVPKMDAELPIEIEKAFEKATKKNQRAKTSPRAARKPRQLLTADNATKMQPDIGSANAHTCQEIILTPTNSS